MTWWGTDLGGIDGFQPKQKNRFIVEFSDGKLMSLKTCGKPTATIESKEYKLINHYYNYPGLVKWEQITMTFVDAKFFATNIQPAATEGQVKAPMSKMTSTEFWTMLVGSGYTPPSYTSTDIVGNSKAPRFTGISSPEKASMMDIAFGGQNIKIHQITPQGYEKIVNTNALGQDAYGLSTNETWELFNPIITKLSWGDLSYDSDDFVEYTMDIKYDWAVYHPFNPSLVPN